VYVLDFRNAHSRFYKSIHISYPSDHDRALARSKGVMPGGDVFVHGLLTATAQSAPLTD
jgi:murein L,D-transpeptidase YafK